MYVCMGLGLGLCVCGWWGGGAYEEFRPFTKTKKSSPPLPAPAHLGCGQLQHPRLGVERGVQRLAPRGERLAQQHAAVDVEAVKGEDADVDLQAGGATGRMLALHVLAAGCWVDGLGAGAGGWG